MMNWLIIALLGEKVHFLLFSSSLSFSLSTPFWRIKITFFLSSRQQVCCPNGIFGKYKVLFLLFSGKEFFFFSEIFFLFFCFEFRSLRFLENGIDRGVAFHLTQDDISQTLYPAVCFASSGHEAIMRTEGVGMMIKPAKRG